MPASGAPWSQRVGEDGDGAIEAVLLRVERRVAADLWLPPVTVVRDQVRSLSASSGVTVGPPMMPTSQRLVTLRLISRPSLLGYVEGVDEEGRPLRAADGGAGGNVRSLPFWPEPSASTRRAPP